MLNSGTELLKEMMIIPYEKIYNGTRREILEKSKAVYMKEARRRQEKVGGKMHRVNRNEDSDKYIRELIDMVYSTIEGYEKYLLDQINHSDLSRIMIELKKYADEYTSHMK